MRPLFAAAALVCLGFGAHAEPNNCAPGLQPMQRIELYFGMNGKRGPRTEAEWHRFLKTDLTPRFPGGFTDIPASGQWRGQGGRIARERSHVVTIVALAGPSLDRSLDEIRNTFRRRFAQESVLRVDRSVCAGF